MDVYMDWMEQEWERESERTSSNEQVSEKRKKLWWNGWMEKNRMYKKIVKAFSTYLGHILNWKILLNLLKFEKPKISKSMVETHLLNFIFYRDIKLLIFSLFSSFKISITKSFEQRLFYLMTINRFRRKVGVNY
jgi:hypothetical protein